MTHLLVFKRNGGLSQRWRKSEEVSTRIRNTTSKKTVAAIIFVVGCAVVAASDNNTDGNTNNFKNTFRFDTDLGWWRRVLTEQRTASQENSYDGLQGETAVFDVYPGFEEDQHRSIAAAQIGVSDSLSGCDDVIFSDTKTFRATSPDKLHSIRIWHSLQGRIEFVRANADDVQFTVTRKAKSRHLLENIVINEQDNGSSFVLYVKKSDKGDGSTSGQESEVPSNDDSLGSALHQPSENSVDLNVFAGVVTASTVVLLMFVCVTIAHRHRYLLRHDRHRHRDQLPVDDMRSETVRTRSLAHSVGCAECSVGGYDGAAFSSSISRGTIIPGVNVIEPAVCIPQNAAFETRSVLQSPAMASPQTGSGNSESTEDDVSSNFHSATISPAGGLSSLHRATLLLVCVTSAILATAPTDGLARSCVTSGFTSYESQVDLVISLPTSFNLDEISVFVDTAHRNRVIVDQQNSTVVTVYDVNADVLQRADLRPRSCEQSSTCRMTSSFDVISCSGSHTGERLCFCPRGFKPQAAVGGHGSFVCVDDDECTSWPFSICPPEAACNNLNGSYQCICPHGRYYDSHINACIAEWSVDEFATIHRSKECSLDCPVDHFVASVCTETRDLLCSPCAVCEHSAVEIQPCVGSRNRKCAHVAFPWLASNDLSSVAEGMFSHQLNVTSRYRKRLRVESNGIRTVLLENLHSTRQLETTYYVTDSKQLSDFVWFRESGLRVHIGLSSVDVVPVYEDVDHATGNDNDYYLSGGGTASPDDREYFRSIMAEQCRYPMPDQYTLTMEIAKDRTTKTVANVCRPADNNPFVVVQRQPAAVCRGGVQSGDRFYQRSLNEPCDKMGSFPDELKSAANSIVCTTGGLLLEELFNITPSVERPVSFPSKPCRLANQRCDQCLDNDNCGTVTDPLDFKCCQLNCYSSTDCKIAASGDCGSAPVECAMGDSYRFTLQPIFPNPRTEFRCHVRRRRPELLYQVWFYVSLPSAAFVTDRFQSTVRPSMTSSSGNGSHVVEFLTIDHVTGVQQLHDEFLLVGRRVEQTTQTAHAWNFSVHSVKLGHDASHGRGLQTNDAVPWHRIASHSISNNIRVAATQPVTPFAYSTSSWASRDYRCDVDVTSFRPVTRLTAPSGGGSGNTGNSGIAQRVAAEVTTLAPPLSAGVNMGSTAQRQQRSGFEYRLKAMLSSPHLHFSVSGNTSVLRWWFRNVPTRLMTSPESLVTELVLSEDQRMWMINISGRMSDCPGFLSVVINDLTASEELFRYDVLVTCPSTFNLTFFIPTGTSPMHTTVATNSYAYSKRPSLDKTFQLILDDAKRPYNVFLSYFRSTASTPTLTNADVDRSNSPDEVYDKRQHRTAKISASDVNENGASRDDGSSKSPFILVPVASVVSVACLLIVGTIAVRLVRKFRHFMVEGKTSISVDHNGSTTAQLYELTSALTCQHLKIRLGLASLYLVVKLVYSTILTFTVLSIAAEIYCSRFLTSASSAANITASFDMSTWLHRFSSHVVSGTDEFAKRQLKEVAERLETSGHSTGMACARHIGELSHLVSIEIASSADYATTALRQASTAASGASIAVANLCSQRLASGLEQFAEHVTNEFDRRTSPMRQQHETYYRRVSGGQWLLFPRSLFNRSNYPAAQHGLQVDVDYQFLEEFSLINRSASFVVRPLHHRLSNVLEDFLATILTKKIIDFPAEVQCHADGQQLARQNRTYTPNVELESTNSSRHFVSISRTVAITKQKQMSAQREDYSEHSLQFSAANLFPQWSNVVFVLYCLDVLMLIRRLTNDCCRFRRFMTSSCTRPCCELYSTVEPNWKSYSVVASLADRQSFDSASGVESSATTLATSCSMNHVTVPPKNGDCKHNRTFSSVFPTLHQSAIFLSILRSKIIPGLVLPVSSFVVLLLMTSAVVPLKVENMALLLARLRLPVAGGAENWQRQLLLPVTGDLHHAESRLQQEMVTSHRLFSDVSLSHLSVIVERYQTELDSVISRSRDEACTISKAANTSSYCDVTNTAASENSAPHFRWYIPFSSCNFPPGAVAMHPLAGDQLMTSIEKYLAELDVFAKAVGHVFRTLLIAAIIVCVIALTTSAIENALFHTKCSSLAPSQARDADIDDVRDFAECSLDNPAVTATSSNISTYGPVDCRTFPTATSSSTLAFDRQGNVQSSDFRRIFRSTVETDNVHGQGHRDVVMFDFGAGFAETNV